MIKDTNDTVEHISEPKLTNTNVTNTNNTNTNAKKPATNATGRGPKTINTNKQTNEAKTVVNEQPKKAKTTETGETTAVKSRSPKYSNNKNSQSPKLKMKLTTKNNGKLKIASLGGLQEIGKNITMFEYEGEIIIVDCGVAFPHDDMLGIDLVTPDFTYLIKNKEKIHGLFLTHGHEDHIGSIPYLLKNFSIPIYGTTLTLGLVENKLREHNLKTELNKVNAGDKIKVGSFEVEFIHVNHSIVDACALAIKTPVGTVIHSGDFKIDFTPINGKTIDLQRFGELGQEGVLLYLCESTNIEHEGYTMSERNVGKIFESIFENSDNQRIMVATFSSNIHRIQQIVDYAVKNKRKIAIMGRSMVNNIRTASELGYLTIPENVLIDTYDIKKYEDDQLVIITTGSQGEPMAALSRMASSEHKQVEIKPGDKIVISASPIPGNEKTVSKVINELMKKGAEVIYEGKMDIHVSGHAKQEEIKVMHTLIKPKYFMPVHGEYRHLKRHKDLAVSLGMNKDDVFIMNIGEVLEIDAKGAAINGNIPSGQILIDGLGIGDVGNIVLRDRKHLSEDGLMVVVIGIEKESGTFVAGPDIISRGFVYVRESEELMDKARAVVRGAIEKCEGKNDWTLIKSTVRDDLKDYLWQKTKRSPMILPVIMEM